MIGEHVRALLLDALGTLVRLEPPAPQLVRELHERFGLELTEAQAARALAAEIAYYRAHLDEGRDAAALTALRRRCAGVLRGALPPSRALDAIGAEELTAALLASLRFTAYADAHPALGRARQRGLRIVVLSNWDVSLHEVLARLELEPLADAILTSAEVGARKPARAIFEHALALAGTAPEHALHVGDSLEEDVAGARAAGVEPVLIRRDGVPAPPGTRAIAALTELLPGTT